MSDPDIHTDFLSEKKQSQPSSNNLDVDSLAKLSFGKKGQTQMRVVLDGNNIAYSSLDEMGRPRVSNIIDALARLAALEGVDIIACFVSAKLRHTIDDPDKLEELIKAGLVIQSPAEVDDDFFILETADEFDALIVSNDRYKKFRKKYPWLSNKRVPFVMVRDKIIFAGQLGK